MSLVIADFHNESAVIFLLLENLRSEIRKFIEHSKDNFALPNSSFKIQK